MHCHNRGGGVGSTLNQQRTVTVPTVYMTYAGTGTQSLYRPWRLEKRCDILVSYTREQREGDCVGNSETEMAVRVNQLV